MSAVGDYVPWVIREYASPLAGSLGFEAVPIPPVLSPSDWLRSVCRAFTFAIDIFQGLPEGFPAPPFPLQPSPASTRAHYSFQRPHRGMVTPLRMKSKDVRVRFELLSQAF